MALPDFDMVNIANKSIYRQVKMLKDLINEIPTSRGMNSCRDQHLCLDQHLCPADPHVNTRPSSPLLVGTVYIFDHRCNTYRQARSFPRRGVPYRRVGAAVGGGSCLSLRLW